MAKVTTKQLREISDRLGWAKNDLHACVSKAERAPALVRLDAVVREAVELRKLPTRANVDPFYPEHVDGLIASGNVLLAKWTAKDAPERFELQAPARIGQ